MSYAAVTSHGVPPAEHPTTDTSAKGIYGTYEDDSAAKRRARKDEMKDVANRAENETFWLYGRAKEQILRPGVAGGLLGLVNLGLMGAAGYQFYTRPELRTDWYAVGGTAAGALLILGGEGILADSYAQTDAGKREAHRAKEEGVALWSRTKEMVLRPGVFGGLLGVANVGILGGVGYLAYTHWDEPSWDQKTVGGISAGLFVLMLAEGSLEEYYRKNEYPKRK